MRILHEACCTSELKTCWRTAARFFSVSLDKGVAHFCLVGAGGDIGQRKNTAPSDLSGEAMGLRPTSKGDSPGGTAALSEINTKGDRASDGSLSVKSDATASRDNKDGGFNWMGGFSRALSRGPASPEEREGEEIGREEDVQVARFVLMLLQYNFPYISHVRGDMDACLEELSAQVSGPLGRGLLLARRSRRTWARVSRFSAHGETPLLTAETREGGWRGVFSLAL